MAARKSRQRLVLLHSQVHAASPHQWIGAINRQGETCTHTCMHSTWEGEAARRPTGVFHVALPLLEELRPRTMFSVFSVVFSESLLNRNDQHGSGSEAR